MSQEISGAIRQALHNANADIVELNGHGTFFYVVVFDRLDFKHICIENNFPEEISTDFHNWWAYKVQNADGSEDSFTRRLQISINDNLRLSVEDRKLTPQDIWPPSANPPSLKL